MTAEQAIQMALLIQSENENEAAKHILKLYHDAFKAGLDKGEEIATKVILNTLNIK